MISKRHWLTILVVMDFRFLAALGMTGRRGWIIATIPFCLPLSAPAGGETKREGTFPILRALRALCGEYW